MHKWAFWESSPTCSFAGGHFIALAKKLLLQIGSCLPCSPASEGPKIPHNPTCPDRLPVAALLRLQQA
jgi:hypothetical protein